MARFLSDRGRRHSAKRRLVLADAGFEIIEGDAQRPVESLAWDDVRRIHAFKADVGTYDVVCLAFERSESDELVVTEEDDGFDALRTRMAEVFRTIPEGWHWHVSMPPFEPRLTLLYPRDPADPLPESPPETQDDRQAGGGAVDCSGPTRWDYGTAICGLMAGALAFGTGRPWMVAMAATSAVGVVVCARVTRRVYNVWDPPRWLGDEVHRQDIAPADRELMLASLESRRFRRVVPGRLRGVNVALRLANVFLLVAALWGISS